MNGLDWQKADIYSFGVIIYILLFNIPPFYSNNEQDIITLVKRGKYNFPNKSNVSKLAKNFVQSCLQYNSDLRPDVIELLNHPWITDIHEKTSSSFSSALSVNNKNVINKIRKRRDIKRNNSKKEFFKKHNKLLNSPSLIIKSAEDIRPKLNRTKSPILPQSDLLTFYNTPKRLQNSIDTLSPSSSKSVPLLLNQY